MKAYALIIIKSKPGHEADHSLELTMDTPDGKQVNVTEKPEVVRIKSRLANVPGGLTVVVQLDLKPKIMGTYILRAYVDGEEVGSAPITLLKHAAEAAH